jgi:hypothetical protein
VKDGCEDEIALRRTSRQSVGRPKKAAESGPAKIPRVSRLMALAIKLQSMVDRGEVRDYADLARLGYVTRARVTQIMNLLLLAPDIQEQLLFSPPFLDQLRVKEGDLRSILREAAWAKQRTLWGRRQRAAC